MSTRHPTTARRTRQRDSVSAAEKLPVAERFVSVNGEGAHAGQFSTFIRFRGCNLACSYCDTRWACNEGCPVEELTVEELSAYAAEQQTPCITLTGGEPLLQPQLAELVDALAFQTECFVEIETNGACDIASLAELRRRQIGVGHLGFTLDCKSPSSGMNSKMLTSNYEHLTADDCVKFVVGSREDLDSAAAVIEEHELLSKCPVFFSPIFGQIEPADIVDYLSFNGLRDARVQVQLHKVIWPGVEKGV